LASPRAGSRRAKVSPCCVVRAAGDDEAWLAVAVDSDRAWRGLCGAIGRGDLADLAFADRKAREDEVEAAVAAWAADKEARAAATLLQQAGVAAAPVLATHQLCGDPQLAASDFWATQQRRYLGEHLTPKPPFRFDGERPALRRPAPVLGEHTAEVLAELGVSLGA
jgi:crotonobetainyl-CoA:carnitine CoA-transferase CaiB-like acyl-CoA transferase